MKKAITHLKLHRANAGKLHTLDALATEHQRVVQAYVDWLIAHQDQQPNKYANIPVYDVPTPLSDRWQRCAWQQACGIVRSWSANARHHPPVLRHLCIQANANVVVIEPSRTPTCDFWLRISTLETGKPIRVPLTLYGRAKEALTAFPKLCTGVTLHRRDGRWYATLVVERRAAKAKSHAVIGVDIGMATIVATSAGNRYGHITLELRQRVERSTAKHRRKQKLNACLKRKGLPTVDLADGQAEAFARNAIGCALNHMLDALPTDAAIAVERLTVQEMRLKSRQMNRALRASQLGYVHDKLTFKLEERGIRYRRVQAAYSSQECAMCGFVHKGNRPSQAAFTCLRCGHTENADVNAARNIAKRFGDDELNQLHFRDVQAVLQERFARRLSPDARSASAGLDTSPGTSGGESYKKSIGPVQTSVS